MTNLPTNEAIARLFPPEVVEVAQRVAYEKDPDPMLTPPDHPASGYRKDRPAPST